MPALKKTKDDNYRVIYGNERVTEADGTIGAMMSEIYEKLLSDLSNGRRSPVFTHHIEYVNKPYYHRKKPYEETEKNQIVVDYIASMTDDYFIDLHRYLFPDSHYEIRYKGYFDDM